jgi:purine nucleoside phosphorylase
MLGVIGGSGMLELGKKGSPKEVKTRYGSVSVCKVDGFSFIQRHGESTPPHRINHRANIQAAKDLGITEIIGISSVGSLKKTIKPGSIVVIDDYIQFSDIMTFYDDSMTFVRPQISEAVRSRILTSAAELGVKVRQRGVYAQTRGPRFETRAEVRMLSRFADVVGMTIANEATLAAEAGVSYACICSVDNYANGMSGTTVSDELIRANQQRNLAKVLSIIARVTR